ncbi:MAG: CaiB/BaiF CoA-transferase family protein [Pseudomonadota bacterium]
MPLEGIRILDLSRLLPGPYGVMLLADMGAEVIKIEQPGYQSNIMNRRPVVDRNKKSIVLNLKIKAAQEVFYKLTEKSDVIVEGFRPGLPLRLGVDYETLKKLNPRIIYCSITGYGQDGPYRDFPGHDPNYLSMAGILGITGTAGGNHVLPGIPIADLTGGMHVAFSVLCALWVREKTGVGQYIDISITDAMVSWLGLTRGNTFLRTGRAFRLGERPSHVYKTKDGKFICIAPIEPHFWERLCHVLGIEEYIPYHHEVLIYAPPSPQKRDEILARLAEIFFQKTRDEWMALLIKEDIPASPVYQIQEALQDPHFIHRGMVEEIEDPELGKVKQVGIAVKLSDTPGKVRNVAPLPGEHTMQIMKDLGYSDEDIKELRRKGITG